VEEKTDKPIYYQSGGGQYQGLNPGYFRSQESDIVLSFPK
jgi:hypothetical protein